MQAKEFFERERALSVVVRHQQQWLKQREISQLHSLIRWENEINNILRAEGQQILYIYNDVDYTRRRHDFTVCNAKSFQRHLNPVFQRKREMVCRSMARFTFWQVLSSETLRMILFS